jgi:hypothetical protein
LTDDERLTLALVASDRRILALLESSYDDPTYLHVVKLMGSAYEDRPGYRDEWWPAGVARETDDAPVMPAVLTMVAPPVAGEIGSCNLCGQVMIRTEDDCWHPYYVAKACPPEPSSVPWDAEGWRKFSAAGLATLRPGREHFTPNPS